MKQNNELEDVNTKAANNDDTVELPDDDFDHRHDEDYGDYTEESVEFLVLASQRQQRAVSCLRVSLAM